MLYVCPLMEFVEETAGPLHHLHSEMCFNSKNLVYTSMFMCMLHS